MVSMAVARLVFSSLDMQTHVEISIHYSNLATALKDCNKDCHKVVAFCARISQPCRVITTLHDGCKVVI